MNILLVSQCNKRALTETRRILDQFAERRGDRTWQTPITKAGLDTLRRLLRKTARKNTAVACHWIRGLNHSEVLWIVGDRNRFNEQGAVPTNTTQSNILQRDDENDWHSGELIGLMVDLAGLLHDLGKAIKAFQDKLHGRSKDKTNLIRHEWVSLRLFEAFVGDDDDKTWLARLIAPSKSDDKRWIAGLKRDGLDEKPKLGSPFKNMAAAPLAQAIGWLVVTHHRLPVLPDRADFQFGVLRGILDHIGPAWNEREFQQSAKAERVKRAKPYWKFAHGIPATTARWRHRSARIGRRLLRVLDQNPALKPLNDPFVMHLSRLSLMLADHYYSSLKGDRNPERVAMQPDPLLHANTADGQLNQSLEEHLVGVARTGAEIARFLPKFDQHLPRIARHRWLQKRTKSGRFAWQNKAADLANGMRKRSFGQGAFIVNMASTGGGKTLANARIMYALADPGKGMRCAFALGLRTLSLQTGRVYRDKLGLNDEDLAIRVGGSANRVLFEHHEKMAEKTGSESNQSLFDDENDFHVHYEGRADDHPVIRRATANPQYRSLLLAPILVCTIDHLIPATESQRGGRQIVPMLRLLSGDLVLDEPDDFDLNDLPALTRLIHWAGLLGARVLLSSATLPPALVQGLFEAYKDGRQHHNRNCGPRLSQTDTLGVCCAWVDEFTQHQVDCGTSVDFEQAHHEFVSKRHIELLKMAANPRRRAVLIDLPELGRDQTEIAEAFATSILSSAKKLHQHHHSIDPKTNKKVSFGLVRMANIEPIYEVALALYRQGALAGQRIHLCVYHSRHPLLIRSAIERQLDTALMRDDPDAVFQIPDIRRRLDANDEPDQMFIVLGSPVTEVGRDHDYDWAIVEPSSMRSIIQLVGRVRRHRYGSVSQPNIMVFRHNFRHFRKPDKAVFNRPGFETDHQPFRLFSHDLGQLVRSEEIEIIDSRPRIMAKDKADFRPQHRLVDLEHARLRAQMLVQDKAQLQSTGVVGKPRRGRLATPLKANASSWWNLSPQDALMTAVLLQEQPFRRSSGGPEVDLVLLPDEDEETAKFFSIFRDGRSRYAPDLYVPADKRLSRIADEALEGVRMQSWGVSDYMIALAQLADELDLPLMSCAKRFGRVTVFESESGWRYHPALGFSKSKQ